MVNSILQTSSNHTIASEQTLPFLLHSLQHRHSSIFTSGLSPKIQNIHTQTHTMSSSPKFFRMVLQRNLDDPKLMIPKKFVEDYDGRRSSDFGVTIFDPTGVETKYFSSSPQFNEDSYSHSDSDSDSDSDGNTNTNSDINTDSDSDESSESFRGHSKKRKNVSVPCSQSRRKMRKDDSFTIKTEPAEAEAEAEAEYLGVSIVFKSSVV
uniref:Uncharacterized protein n=1 Tax=Cucumis melo TaxID=3656 RepID=A0A9I9EF59_CUCME